MKKTHFITTLLISALVLASCNGNAGTAPDTSDGNGDVATYKAGDSALANIIINGKAYDKTGEVYVTGPDGATVIGADPSFIASDAKDKCKGVFRKEKNVSLNPYIMSKYPVTQELYTAVMTGNADGVIAEPFECKQTGDYPLVTGEVQKYRAAEGMSWYDAVYFCNALTETTMTAADKVYTIKNITVDPTKGIFLLLQLL